MTTSTVQDSVDTYLTTKTRRDRNNGASEKTDTTRGCRSNNDDRTPRRFVVHLHFGRGGRGEWTNGTGIRYLAIRNQCKSV